jgi:hypothetical protein
MKLELRIEKIESALRATRADESDAWFEIVKEKGITRAQEILAARGMTDASSRTPRNLGIMRDDASQELETLRAMMTEAHAQVEQWERETFGENTDAFKP